jgi:hypothetical protein
VPGRAGLPRLRRNCGENGSIVLFVLFVCLAVAVVVQALSAVVLCADRGLEAESYGRARMEEKDQMLASLRQRLLGDWGAVPWSLIGEKSEVQGRVAEVADSGGWVVAVSAWHEPAVSPITVSAWVERGRDGIDLPPWAGCGKRFVASKFSVDHIDGRDRGRRDVRRPATALVGGAAALLAGQPAWPNDNGVWLDDGSGLSCELKGVERTGGDGASWVRRGGQPVSARSGWGTTGTTRGGGFADDPPSVGREAPRLTPATGDVYGVIGERRSVVLEGTRIRRHVRHGRTDFRMSGAVFSRGLFFRPPTDRSCARLVPGTRGEHRDR